MQVISARLLGGPLLHRPLSGRAGCRPSILNDWWTRRPRRLSLLEDLGETRAALVAYQGALAEDPDLADCHFNLARLYESLGKSQHAIRHLGQYRRLVANDGR